MKNYINIIYNFFAKDLMRIEIIKYTIIILFYIIDFVIIQFLGIAMISIAFVVDCVISMGLLFLVRKFFSKLRNRIKQMQPEIKTT